MSFKVHARLNNRIKFRTTLLHPTSDVIISWSSGYCLCSLSSGYQIDYEKERERKGEKGISEREKRGATFT